MLHTEEAEVEQFYEDLQDLLKLTPIKDALFIVGNWNVRPMNQGKLEVVKQDMAKVNINILGISKLKWTGMGEFNSDDREEEL